MNCNLFCLCVSENEQYVQFAERVEQTERLDIFENISKLLTAPADNLSSHVLNQHHEWCNASIQHFTLLFDELAWSLSHSDSDNGTDLILLLFLVGGGSSSRLPSESSEDLWPEFLASWMGLFQSCCSRMSCSQQHWTHRHPCYCCPVEIYNLATSNLPTFKASHGRIYYMVIPQHQACIAHLAWPVLGPGQYFRASK